MTLVLLLFTFQITDRRILLADESLKTKNEWTG
jgi:hypothetical protein